MAVWMLFVSSPPLGLTVAQTFPDVRFGIPPSDSSPAIFQLAEASRSDGNKGAAGTTSTVKVACGPLAETAVVNMASTASAHRRCLIEVARRSILPLQQNFISRSPSPDCRVIPAVAV